VISRTIVPFIDQGELVSGEGEQTGIGDISQSFFFSPRASKPFIWGVGPVVSLPTATASAVGTEKWGAGPTLVVLVQHASTTVGALANHIWSFAGADDRADVNTTFLQPFVSYTFKNGTSPSLNLEATYDFETDNWTVPLNAGVSTVFAVADQPLSVGLLGKYWLAAPDTAPDWGIRFVLTLLFPVAA
jgi:hypothetical protein